MKKPQHQWHLFHWHRDACAAWLFQYDVVIYATYAPTAVTCDFLYQVIFIVCFPGAQVLPGNDILVLFGYTIDRVQVIIKIKLDRGTGVMH